jgi:hypothetical protein
VDRIIEVAFSDNIDLDAAVAKNQAVIYATRQDRPDYPFWPMLFDNITIRLLGSDDFPPEAKQQAAADLTAAARDEAVSIPIGTPLPLEQAAEAHDRLDAGTHARTLLAIPTDPATLIQSMLAAGLMDDLRLAVEPVLLGGRVRQLPDRVSVCAAQHASIFWIACRVTPNSRAMSDWDSPWAISARIRSRRLIASSCALRACSSASFRTCRNSSRVSW